MHVLLQNIIKHLSIILLILTIAVQFLNNISPFFTDVIFVAVLGIAFVINKCVFVEN